MSQVWWSRKPSGGNKAGSETALGRKREERAEGGKRYISVLAPILPKSQQNCREQHINGLTMATVTRPTGPLSFDIDVTKGPVGLVTMHHRGVGACLGWNAMRV